MPADNDATDLVRKVLLIVPSRGRPDHTLEFYRAFEENSSITDLVFALDDDDESRYPRIGGATYEVNPRLRLAGTFNLVAKKYADKYDYIMCMTDQHRIRTKDWDLTLAGALRENGDLGVAYGNDLIFGERLASSHMFCAKMVRTLGYLIPPELTHLYADNFSIEMGKGLGSLCYKNDVVIQDVHFGLDETLRESNSPDMYIRDHEAFTSYMANRFQSDIEKLLRVRYENITEDYLALPGVVQKLQWDLYTKHPADAMQMDRLERAIMLLTDALKLEPENHSYWFHLAQYYRETEHLEEAAEAYGKRAELGAWDPHSWYARTEAHTRRPVAIGRQAREEEAWYAGVLAARTWSVLGRQGDFLREALAAFNRRPARAEPLYDLARYYRERGMNSTSLLFSSIGLTLPHPDNNALYVEDFVYSAGLQEEYSIAANYSEDPAVKNRGHGVCNWLALNRGVPDRSRTLARSNLFFYAGSASAVMPSFAAHAIECALPDGHQLLSLSIANWAGRIVLLRATSNGKFRDDGRHTPGSVPYSIRNTLLLLRDDFSIDLSKELPSFGSHSREGIDLAALRLFVWRDGLWCLAVLPELASGESCWGVLARIDLAAQDASRLTDMRELYPEDPERNKGDWVPQVMEERLQIIYKCDPISIMDEHAKTTAITAPKIWTEQFYGSSQAIPFDGGSLALIHEITWGGGEPYYHHRFVWFTESGVLRSVSRCFYLKKRGIECVGGLAWHPDGNQLLISYSVDDREIWIGTMDSRDVRDLLEDVERLTTAASLSKDPQAEADTVLTYPIHTGGSPMIEDAESNSDERQAARLFDLFTKWGTDKGVNGYSSLYECLFHHQRLEVRSLLEVGIGTMTPGAHSSMANFAQPGYSPGGSLRAWRDYFPNAFIYGMDIQQDTQFDNEIRIATLLCDSRDADQISQIMRYSPHKSFDIIIDDGSHICCDQLSTLMNLFPRLRAGGTYIIEDLFGDEMLHSGQRITEITGGAPFFFLGPRNNVVVIVKC
jgi:tetratricopeptide (TPR) repeat protein